MTNTTGNGGQAPQGVEEERPLEIARCNPLEVEEELKGLFVDGDTPGFVPFFDHSYPQIVSMGGGSVIARDADGKLVMHLAVFPRIFRSGNSRVRAGLLGDLMVSREYRDFWSPIGFFREAVQMLQNGGDYRFLITDPGKSSLALVRAAGFDVLDSLQRFVFPLVPGWLTVTSLRVPVEKLEAERIPWVGGEADFLQQGSFDCGEAFRVERTSDFYASRRWASLTDESEWIALRSPDGDGTPVAMVLSTPFPDHRTLGLMDIHWDESRVSAESVLQGCLVTARHSGFRKVSVMVTEQSKVAGALRSSGFIPREDEQILLIRTLEDDLELPPSEEWLLTWIDRSAW